MTLDEVIKTAEQRKKLRDDLKATPKDSKPRRNKLLQQLRRVNTRLNLQVAAELRAGVAREEIQAELERRGLR